MSNYNINIDQGATFTLNLTIKESGTPLNLSNYEGGRGQLRSKKESPSAIDLTVAITDAVAGAVQVSLTPTETAALTKGLYYYDVELFTAADAVVTRILRGRASISREITR
jgi:hypothetical protein